MGNSGIIFNGEPSNNIFENVIDEDLASLYPNIILTFNIDANALLGRIECEENAFVEEFFGEVVSSGDVIEMGTKLANLPSVEDVLANLEEFLVE